MKGGWALEQRILPADEAVVAACQHLQDQQAEGNAANHCHADLQPNRLLVRRVGGYGRAHHRHPVILPGARSRPPLLHQTSPAVIAPSFDQPKVG